MQFCVERAMTDPVGGRQRFIEDRKGAADISCTGFGFSESNLDEPV